MAKLDLHWLIARADSLPTLPIIAQRVGELIDDPNSSAQDVAAAMRDDQSLTARVLALVNSAYYAVPGGIGDVGRAVSFLGYNTVYQLVLTVSVFDALPVVPGTAFDIKELWKHSLGCAIASEIIAKHLKMEAPEEVFTAGLLHDIGKVLLASAADRTLVDVVSRAAKSGISYVESEKLSGLPPHDVVGLHLAEKWRLPGRVAAGIGYHHRLQASRIRLPRILHGVVDVVALGDAICRRAELGNGGDEIIEAVDRALLDRLNLSQLALGKIEDEIPRTIENSQIFLEVLA